MQILAPLAVAAVLNRSPHWGRDRDQSEVSPPRFGIYGIGHQQPNFCRNLRPRTSTFSRLRIRPSRPTPSPCIFNLTFIIDSFTRSERHHTHKRTTIILHVLHDTYHRQILKKETPCRSAAPEPSPSPSRSPRRSAVPSRSTMMVSLALWLWAPKLSPSSRGAAQNSCICCHAHAPHLSLVTHP